MDEIQTLTDNNAVDKIKELAGGNTCLFCTIESGKVVSRPMATQAIDDDGTIWFFSVRSSDKNKQLKKDDTVYLMYMDTGKQHYLALTGTADIVIDREKARELWTPIAKAWFEKGVDDPDLTLIKVTPDDGHYWDTKNGKLITLIKIAVSAVTGNHDYNSVQGDLRL